ncbi:MAG: polymer-forming cytoskeletal protein [Halanaeroarchaeum sp.]
MDERSLLRGGAAVIVAALLVLSGFSGVAAAQTGASGTVIVDEGQTSDGISAMAGTVIVRGTVEGDVSVLAGDVVIAESGTVTGSVTGAAGSLRIAGTVNGDVKFAGGSVVLEPTARVGGDVSVGAGSVLLAGTVTGGVSVGAETITVAPSARVGGDLRYDGALEMREGATVGGAVVRDPTIGGGVGPTQWGIPDWLDTVYGFFANLVLGALLLVLFPRFSESVADGVRERPLRSGGWGLVALFGVPILVVLLAITLVGIPVALLVLLLYLLAVWVAVVYGEYAVGRVIVSRLGSEGRWWALLAGLLAFTLVGLVPVVGAIPTLLALLVGLGALAGALRQVWNRRGEGPSAAETEPAPGADSGAAGGD